MKAMVLAISLLALVSVGVVDNAGAAGPRGGRQGAATWECPMVKDNTCCQGQRRRDGSCLRGTQTGPTGKGAPASGQGK